MTLSLGISRNSFRYKKKIHSWSEYVAHQNKLLYISNEFYLSVDDSHDSPVSVKYLWLVPSCQGSRWSPLGSTRHSWCEPTLSHFCKQTATCYHRCRFLFFHRKVAEITKSGFIVSLAWQWQWIIYTLLQPKGRLAEQGSVNKVEKQFIVKLYTQYKIHTQY